MVLTPFFIFWLRNIEAKKTEKNVWKVKFVE